MTTTTHTTRTKSAPIDDQSEASAHLETPAAPAHERIICPVARTAEIISGKWTLLIIRDLTTGTKRFSELERSLEGISPKTLSERLVALEREGMLTRRTYAEVPPKVEYSLTVKGQALASVIEAMRAYGSAWLDCSAK